MKFINIKTILFLSVAMILASCSGSTLPSLKPIDSSSKRVALLIGVEDYAGDNDDLIGIDKDITKMSTLFKSWGFTVNSLKNSLNLKSHLANYSRTLKKNDILIVYYSGHGTSVRDLNGDEADGRDEALVLSNSITNQYLVDDSFNIYLNQISARKLIIVDSCHSGTINKSFQPPNIALIKTSNKPLYLSTTNIIDLEEIKTDNEKKKESIFKKTWNLTKKRIADAKYNEMKKNSIIKFIRPSSVGKAYSSEDDIYRPTEATISDVKISGEYVFFGATQDNQKSLATRSGSIFTNSFASKIDTKKSINIIYRDIANNIRGFQPSLKASSSSFQNQSMNSYLKMK